MIALVIPGYEEEARINFIRGLSLSAAVDLLSKSFYRQACALLGIKVSQVRVRVPLSILRDNTSAIPQSKKPQFGLSQLELRNSLSSLKPAPCWWLPIVMKPQNTALRQLFRGKSPNASSSNFNTTDTLEARSYRLQTNSSHDLCPLMSGLYLGSQRTFHSSTSRRASTTTTEHAVSTPKSQKPAKAPSSTTMTTKQRLEVARKRAAQRLKDEQAEQERNFKLGGLSSSSLFGEDLVQRKESGVQEDESLLQRNPENMAQVLNPRPTARSRWQRKMVIRDLRRRGRPNKEMRIARSERNHLSRSHFFKTSMKKLAPLARQIAGKSIDEAILQMRFSKKKVAQEVRQHLIQARDEAVVMKGMGLGAAQGGSEDATTTPAGQDPSETRPLPHQTPAKALKKGHTPEQTDIYVAQAWTNRGPYGKEPEFRARGRVYMLRPPQTGISVLLKEEKTRTRENAEKEAKALRKRMGKSMWVHLPDRKITAQRQHALW